MRLLRTLRGAREDPRVQPRSSIYAHIAGHVPPSGPGLTPGGELLPDEPAPIKGLRWAPGALDGVFSTHTQGEAQPERVETTFGLIAGAVRGDRPTDPATVASFEEALGEDSLLSVVDPLLEQIVASDLPPAGIEALGRTLALTSGTRNAVKLGIALIGIVPGSSDRELLMTLGRHDEFTLYAAIALARRSDDAETALWDLARVVDGWGRVQVVRRLEGTQRPDIRDWILRTGFRNTIMDEYLAWTAATTGGLVAALEAPEPDDEVLVAACDIVSALIAGGPARDIDDYRGGAAGARAPARPSRTACVHDPRAARGRCHRAVPGADRRTLVEAGRDSVEARPARAAPGDNRHDPGPTDVGVRRRRRSRGRRPTPGSTRPPAPRARSASIRSTPRCGRSMPSRSAPAGTA